MDSSSADAALLLELEEKITTRIRDQMYMVANNDDTGWSLQSATRRGTDGPIYPDQIMKVMAQQVGHYLVNNAEFMRNLMQFIGTRMKEYH